MSKKHFTSSRALQFGTNGNHHFEAAIPQLHCTTPIRISDSARPSGARSNIFHHNTVWCPIKESPNLIDSIAGLEKTS
jgi:hypothetical protein